MLDDKDLKVEAFVPSQYIGGMQPARTPPTTIRVTHIPSGIVAECTLQSQHKSRLICKEMIIGGLTSKYLH